MKTAFPPCSFSIVKQNSRPKYYENISKGQNGDLHRHGGHLQNAKTYSGFSTIPIVMGGFSAFLEVFGGLLQTADSWGV